MTLLLERMVRRDMVLTKVQLAIIRAVDETSKERILQVIEYFYSVFLSTISCKVAPSLRAALAA